MAEVKFARQLASNDGKTRSRAFRSVRRWLSQRSAVEGGLDDAELLKLWKGLYVCMWHSDKPVVQEELADSISALTHSFQQPRLGLRFVAVFVTSMVREWQSIDRLRLDKFYLLIRKVLAAAFQLLARSDWDAELVEVLCAVLLSGALSPLLEPPTQTCLGLQLHVVDVFLPELLALAPPTAASSALLRPCCSLLATTTNSSVRCALVSAVFEPLLEIGRRELDLSPVLLQLAVDRASTGSCRKTLYSLHRRFKELSGEGGGEEEEGGGEERQKKKRKVHSKRRKSQKQKRTLS